MFSDKSYLNLETSSSDLCSPANSSLEQQHQPNYPEWLNDFIKKCSNISVTKSSEMLEELMSQFIQEIKKEMFSPHLSPNRAAFIANKMIKTLMFFYLYYSDIREFFEVSQWIENISQLLLYYCQLELKATNRVHRGKDSDNLVSSRIMNALWVYLFNDYEAMIHIVLQIPNIYRRYKNVLEPVFRKLLIHKDQKPITELEYLRNLLAFKLWKRLYTKEDKKAISHLAITEFRPPISFLRNYRKYKFLPPCKEDNVHVQLVTELFDLDAAIREYLEIFKNSKRVDYYLTNRSNFISELCSNFEDIYSTAVDEEIEDDAEIEDDDCVIIDYDFEPSPVQRIIPPAFTTEVIDLTVDEPEQICLTDGDDEVPQWCKELIKLSTEIESLMPPVTEKVSLITPSKLASPTPSILGVNDFGNPRNVISPPPPIEKTTEGNSGGLTDITLTEDIPQESTVMKIPEKPGREYAENTPITEKVSLFSFSKLASPTPSILGVNDFGNAGNVISPPPPIEKTTEGNSGGLTDIIVAAHSVQDIPQESEVFKFPEQPGREYAENTLITEKLSLLSLPKLASSIPSISGDNDFGNPRNVISPPPHIEKTTEGNSGGLTDITLVIQDIPQESTVIKIPEQPGREYAENTLITEKLSLFSLPKLDSPTPSISGDNEFGNPRNVISPPPPIEKTTEGNSGGLTDIIVTAHSVQDIPQESTVIKFPEQLGREYAENTSITEKLSLFSLLNLASPTPSISGVNEFDNHINVISPPPPMENTTEGNSGELTDITLTAHVVQDIPQESTVIKIPEQPGREYAENTPITEKLSLFSLPKLASPTPSISDVNDFGNAGNVISPPPPIEKTTEGNSGGLTDIIVTAHSVQDIPQESTVIKFPEQLGREYAENISITEKLSLFSLLNLVSPTPSISGVNEFDNHINVISPPPPMENTTEGNSGGLTDIPLTAHLVQDIPQESTVIKFPEQLGREYAENTSITEKLSLFSLLNLASPTPSISGVNEFDNHINVISPPPPMEKPTEGNSGGLTDIALTAQSVQDIPQESTVIKFPEQPGREYVENVPLAERVFLISISNIASPTPSISGVNEFGNPSNIISMPPPIEKTTEGNSGGLTDMTLTEDIPQESTVIEFPEQPGIEYAENFEHVDSSSYSNKEECEPEPEGDDPIIKTFIIEQTLPEGTVYSEVTSELIPESETNEEDISRYIVIEVSKTEFEQFVAQNTKKAIENELILDQDLESLPEYEKNEADISEQIVAVSNTEFEKFAAQHVENEINNEVILDKESENLFIDFTLPTLPELSEEYVDRYLRKSDGFYEVYIKDVDPPIHGNIINKIDAQSVTTTTKRPAPKSDTLLETTTRAPETEVPQEHQFAAQYDKNSLENGLILDQESETSFIDLTSPTMEQLSGEDDNYFAELDKINYGLCSRVVDPPIDGIKQKKINQIFGRICKKRQGPKPDTLLETLTRAPETEVPQEKRVRVKKRSFPAVAPAPKKQKLPTDNLLETLTRAPETEVPQEKRVRVKKRSIPAVAPAPKKQKLPKISKETKTMNRNKMNPVVLLKREAVTNYVMDMVHYEVLKRDIEMLNPETATKKINEPPKRAYKKRPVQTFDTPLETKTKRRRPKPTAIIAPISKEQKILEIAKEQKTGKQGRQKQVTTKVVKKREVGSKSTRPSAKNTPSVEVESFPQRGALNEENFQSTPQRSAPNTQNFQSTPQRSAPYTQNFQSTPQRSAPYTQNFQSTPQRSAPYTQNFQSTPQRSAPNTQKPKSTPWRFLFS